MASVDLQIVLELIDKASADIKKATSSQVEDLDKLKKKQGEAFKQWEKDTQKLSNEMKNIGRNVSQVGSAVAFFSAGVLAPMVLALKNSAKTSTEVSETMSRLSDITSEFHNKIASSLLPTINGFINVLTKLYNMFLSIPQPMRDTALQGLFMISTFGVLGGVFLKLIGDIIKLQSNLVALLVTFGKFAVVNPIILLNIAYMAGLLILMLKFKPVADFVLNAFEFLFKNILLQIEIVKAANSAFIASLLKGVSVALSSLARLDVAHSTALINASNAVLGLANDYEVSADESVFAIKRISTEMGNLFVQKGSFALNFDEAKTSINDLVKSFSDINTQGIQPTKIAHQELTQDIVRQENELRVLRKQLASEQYLDEFTANQNRIQLLTEWKNFFISTQLSVTNIQRAGLQAVNSMIDGFGRAFSGMLTQGKSFSEGMKQAFKSMADMFIAEVGKMIAKWLAFLALKAIGKFFGFSGGGFVPSNQFQGGGFGVDGGSGIMKFASGTDRVPALLTPGEIVVPRKMSDSIRSGDLSLGGPQGGKSFGEINITVNYPKMSNSEEVKSLSEMLGFEIEKQLRYSRL